MNTQEGQSPLAVQELSLDTHTLPRSHFLGYSAWYTQLPLLAGYYVYGYYRLLIFISRPGCLAGNDSLIPLSQMDPTNYFPALVSVKYYSTE